MSKKLITGCLALFALAAFALPASASAVEVTHPTGTTMPIHASATKTCAEEVAGCINGTLTGGNSIMWNTAHTIKLLECTSATMTGELTSADPEPKGDITSATFSGTGPLKDGRGECTGELGSSSVDTNIGNGVPWCLSLGASDTWSLRGGKCTEASRSITFVITSTTAGTCKYNRTAAVTGPFTTDTSPELTDAILHAKAGASTEFTKEEGGILCPSAGQLEMSFTLETDTGTAEPIYIS